MGGTWWPSWYPDWPRVDPAPAMVKFPLRADLWLPALSLTCPQVVHVYRHDPGWLIDLIGITLVAASTHLGRPSDVNERQVAAALFDHCARAAR